MSKKLNAIDKAVASGKWKNSKTQTVKPKENPVRIKHYVFWLCQVKKHVDEGYLYYLFTKTYSRRILTEEESHKFKTKQEAIAFANSNQLQGCIPG
jgi:hypothetical protein